MDEEAARSKGKIKSKGKVGGKHSNGKVKHRPNSAKSNFSTHSVMSTSHDFYLSIKKIINGPTITPRSFIRKKRKKKKKRKRSVAQS